MPKDKESPSALEYAGFLPILSKADRAMFASIEQDLYERDQEQRKVQVEIEKGIAKQKAEAAKRSAEKKRMRAGRLPAIPESKRQQKAELRRFRMRREKSSSEMLTGLGRGIDEGETKAKGLTQRGREAFLKDIKHHKKMLAQGDITKEQFNARVENALQEGTGTKTIDEVRRSRDIVRRTHRQTRTSRGVSDPLATKKPGEVLTKAEQRKADKLNTARQKKETARKQAGGKSKRKYEKKGKGLPAEGSKRQQKKADPSRKGGASPLTRDWAIRIVDTSDPEKGTRAQERIDTKKGSGFWKRMGKEFPELTRLEMETKLDYHMRYGNKTKSLSVAEARKHLRVSLQFKAAPHETAFGWGLDKLKRKRPGGIVREQKRKKVEAKKEAKEAKHKKRGGLSKAKGSKQTIKRQEAGSTGAKKRRTYSSKAMGKVDTEAPSERPFSGRTSDRRAMLDREKARAEALIKKEEREELAKKKKDPLAKKKPGTVAKLAKGKKHKETRPKGHPESKTSQRRSKRRAHAKEQRKAGKPRKKQGLSKAQRALEESKYVSRSRFETLEMDEGTKKKPKKTKPKVSERFQQIAKDWDAPEPKKKKVTIADEIASVAKEMKQQPWQAADIDIMTEVDPWAGKSTSEKAKAKRKARKVRKGKGVEKMPGSIAKKAAKRPKKAKAKQQTSARFETLDWGPEPQPQSKPAVAERIPAAKKPKPKAKAKKPKAVIDVKARRKGTALTKTRKPKPKPKPSRALSIAKTVAKGAKTLGKMLVPGPIEGAAGLAFEMGESMSERHKRSGRKTALQKTRAITRAAAKKGKPRYGSFDRALESDRRRRSAQPARSKQGTRVKAFGDWWEF